VTSIREYYPQHTLKWQQQKIELTHYQLLDQNTLLLCFQDHNCSLLTMPPL
jgi:hypothetical protein